jgi:rod shape-determining protein MreC
MGFRNKPLIIVIAIAVLLVSLMVFLPGTGKVDGPQGIVGNIVSGATGVFDAIGGFFSRLFTSVFRPGTLEDENQALKEQIAIYEYKINGMSEMEQENQRLKQMLNYIEQAPEYDYIIGRVIMKEPGYWFDVFDINVGVNQGVEEGDAVITPDGLAGRVLKVGGNYSTVVAIIDSRVSVSAVIERTRDNGIVKGGMQLSDEGGLCSMSFLPLDADLQVGDRVVTSGLGGVFPKGLYVGQVSQVGTGTDKQVVVKPAVDFLHVEEVMVVKEKTGSAGGDAGTGDVQ